MSSAVKGDLWSECPLGKTGKRLVIGLVAISMLADLVVFLGGEEREVALAERLFGLALAAVVALFVWRPTLAALGLLVLLPLSELAGSDVMLRLTLPIVVGLVVATCGRAFIGIFLAVALAWYVGMEVFSPEPNLLTIVFTLVVGTCSALLGAAARRARTREVELSQTIAQQEATIAQVRQLEQERIADELHDGIARQLTTIAIQVKVLGRTDDPALRGVSQQAIADSSARALADVRRVLQLGGGHDQESVSLEDWNATVAQEVAALRSQGYDVVADAVATPPLSSVVSATLVRILREAVHNVRTHEPTTAQILIEVSHEGDEVELSVTNGPPRSPGHSEEHRELAGGYGLVRLTERVRALGGQLGAGATHDGGWCVRGRVPIA